MKMSKTEICINGKVYEIGVKTCSFSDFQSIYLDGKLYVKFKGKPASYHMFYNLYIDGKTIIIDIDTSTGALPLAYKYNTYIDGISLEDGTSIYRERQESLETVSDGFKAYCRRNIKDAFKVGIVTALGSALSSIIGSFIGDVKNFDTHNMVLYTVCVVSIMFPLSSIGMLVSKWIEANGIIKRWNKRYQLVRTRKEKYYM